MIQLSNIDFCRVFWQIIELTGGQYTSKEASLFAFSADRFAKGSFRFCENSYKKNINSIQFQFENT